MYDIAIIGAGPAGYVAAENAGAKGLKVVLFEKKIRDIRYLLHASRFTWSGAS